MKCTPQSIDWTLVATRQTFLLKSEVSNVYGDNLFTAIYRLLYVHNNIVSFHKLCNLVRDALLQ